MLQRVSDQRVGSAFRAVRIRRRWRQSDVAERAGVSSSLVSLVERGHLGTLSVEGLRRVAAVLDIRVDVVARWRGGELDRLLSARHSALQDSVARWLTSLPGWSVLPEVSFAIYAERGVIDLLAWHAPTRTLLVIEVKTEIVDLPELLGVLDRKSRLAPKIARERGWYPRAVATWLVVAEGTTNRRRLADHRALVRSALPAGGRQLRQWLTAPNGRLAAVSFLPYANLGGVKQQPAGTRRVRSQRRPESERGAASRPAAPGDLSCPATGTRV